VYLNYTAVHLLADAIERAKSTKREDITAALEKSSWNDHFMPFGPTRFVNGQNEGARPLMMQVLKNDIRVVQPDSYAETKPVFPWKA
jgi:branched-chain amino acid transport system substrate-binding protein